MLQIIIQPLTSPFRNLVDTTNRGALDVAQFILAMYLIQGSMSANPTIPFLPPSLPTFLWEQAGFRPPSVHSHTTGKYLSSPKLPPLSIARVGVPRTFTPQYTGGSGTSHQPGSTIGSQRCLHPHSRGQIDNSDSSNIHQVNAQGGPPLLRLFYGERRAVSASPEEFEV